MSEKWKGFENNVSKKVSEWLFGDEKVLRRSPCSGGWKARGSDGDIILASDEDAHKQEFMFVIEAKCRKSRGGGEWHLEQLLTCPKHQILEWWYQVTNSKPALDDGKQRMLVFSKTSGIAKAYVALGETEIEFIEEAGISLRALPKIVFEVGRCEDPNVNTEILHFFNFREFIDYVDPQPLKDLWRRKNGFSEA